MKWIATEPYSPHAWECSSPFCWLTSTGQVRWCWDTWRCPHWQNFGRVFRTFAYRHQTNDSAAHCFLWWRIRTKWAPAGSFTIVTEGIHSGFVGYECCRSAGLSICSGCRLLCSSPDTLALGQLLFFASVRRRLLSPLFSHGTLTAAQPVFPRTSPQARQLLRCGCQLVLSSMHPLSVIHGVRCAPASVLLPQLAVLSSSQLNAWNGRVRQYSFADGSIPYAFPTVEYSPSRY